MHQPGHFSPNSILHDNLKQETIIIVEPCGLGPGLKFMSNLSTARLIPNIHHFVNYKRAGAPHELFC